MVTADEAPAVEVARTLIAAGVPIFAARPARNDTGSWNPEGGTGGTGYYLPPAWEKTVATPAWLDPSAPGFADKAWRSGWALCAVMGCGLDLLDVDPRNGGDHSRAELVAAGLWPRSYAAAATPSGGTHDFVASLGAGSRDAVLPGLDVKAGQPDGSGRGFAFIAPTVKLSKTTGELAVYRWTMRPDLDALAEGDDSGEGMAELVRKARQTERHGSTRSNARTSRASDARRHQGAVPEGQRHAALVSYAGSLRRRGVWLDEALPLIRRRWEDCAQPPAASTPLPVEEAEAKLRDVYARYAPGAVPDPDLAVEPPRQQVHHWPSGTPTLAQELDPYVNELHIDPQLLSAVRHQLRQRRARQIVGQVYERRQPRAAPDAGTLAELLARPVSASWRIQGMLPASGRMLWSAQRKTGKTTAVNNLARALITGQPFLGRFPVERLDGRVVVLNYEVTGDQFARWAADVGVPPERLYVINMRGRRNLLADEDGRAELTHTIRQQEGQVLIVDPFGRAYTGKSQNDSAEVTPWLVRLDEVAEQAGTSELILTAHAGWDGERTRGSSALEDWPDVIVTMTRDPATDARFLKAEGRDVEVEEDKLEYEARTRALTLSGSGSRKQVRAEDRMDRLAEHVRDLAAETPGINVSALRDALRKRDEHFQREDANKASRLAESRGWVTVRPGQRGAREHYPPPGVPTGPDASPGPVGSSPDRSYRAGTTTTPRGSSTGPEDRDVVVAESGRTRHDAGATAA